MQCIKSCTPITMEGEIGTERKLIAGTLLTLTAPSGSPSVTLFVEEASWRLATVVSVTNDGKTGRPLPPWVDQEQDTVSMPAFDSLFMDELFEAARSLGAEYLRILDYTPTGTFQSDAHYETTKPYSENEQLYIMFSKFGAWRPSQDLPELVAAAQARSA